MSKRIQMPMPIQPPADGSNVPRQMVSRMELIGPKRPTPHDKALCAKARGDALRKQREALAVPILTKADDAPHPDREKR